MGSSNPWSCSRYFSNAAEICPSSTKKQFSERKKCPLYISTYTWESIFLSIVPSRTTTQWLKKCKNCVINKAYMLDWSCSHRRIRPHELFLPLKLNFFSEFRPLHYILYLSMLRKMLRLAEIWLYGLGWVHLQSFRKRILLQKEWTEKGDESRKEK